MAAAPRAVRRLFFHGTGGTLFRIRLVNAFLALITLGIYYFWGKVEVRRYLLNQAEIEGDRFAYHGTGRELLVGFLKAMLFFGVPFVLLSVLANLLAGEEASGAIVAVLAYLVSLVFVPFATVSARRYRLSRTSWRGIRFSFRGAIGAFIKLFAAGSLLTTVTLGLYYPIFDTARHGFLVSHSYFGNRPFRFSGSGRDLFGPFLVAVLLTLPTLGLCWFWYVARKRRYLWEHTAFDAARFRSTVTGRALLNLTFGNVVLVVLTAGLGRPWVTVRNIRFTFRYLTLDGTLDLEAIQQEARAATATGEGLAGLLDSDAGFDLG